MVVGIIIVMVALFSILSPTFRTYSTFVSVLDMSYYIALMAIGVTFTLITGGVDLSIGTGLICYSLFGGYLIVHKDVPVVVALIACLVLSILLGIKFIVKPVMTTKETMAATDPKKRIIQSIICGTVIGCICGFVGAGGGMMMLLILTSVLGYELKTAVGTSVFIMTFTALTGALSHFAIGGTPDLVVLILCIVSTLIFARVAAVLANKAPAKLLNQATGVILVILGAAIIAVQYVF